MVRHGRAAARAASERSRAPAATPESIQVFNNPGLAPLWAIRFGGEFWRHEASSPTGANPDGAAAAVQPPFSLGEVIERVEHALAVDPATGLPGVDAGNYRARFDGQGLRFSPCRAELQTEEVAGSGPHQGRTEAGTSAIGRPTPDPKTEILFRTVSVQRDGNYFFSAGQDAANWSVVGNTAQSLLSAGQGMIEHYEAGKDGVAVTWVFEKPLPGVGPVEVVAAVEGLRYAGETEEGFHFADRSGVARVRVGQAEAVDAAGTRWDLTLQVAAEDRSRLIVQLPAEIQAEAVYPLVIDPIIGPEFGMDKPVSANASGSQNNAAVANAAGTWFVALEDNRNNGGTRTDIYGARVSSAGTVLDPFGIAICTAPGNQTAPAVAANGTTFLVVWHDQRLGTDTIFGARVTTKGVVSDPNGFAISASDGQFNPCVAAGPTNYFVAWEDDRNGGANGTDIYGARVTTAGVVADPAGIAISTNTTDQLLPTVATNATGYFVAWQDSRNNGPTGTDIYGARVSSAGAVLDPTGVALSTATGNQTETAAAANGSMVLVAWRDRRTSGATSDDIFGTRLTFTNNAIQVLDTNGVAISTNSASQRTPAVCALTNDFLVVWRDRRTSGATSDDIYAARVDVNGAVLETNGFAICTNVASQTAPAVAGSPSGAFVVWTDPRNSNTGNDIYGARVSATGVVLDTNNVPVSLSGAIESAPVVAFHGTNYLVVWEDQRHFATTDSDILGARVSGAGKVLDLSGITLCNQAAAQQHPAVAASGGEFLVAWDDARNALTTGVDIYGTRVSGAGTVLDPAGLALSTAANDEASPAVAGNSSTFLVAWEDNRNGTAPDIFGTLVSQGGIISSLNGFAISSTGANEIRPAIAANANQFLTVWEDNNDIFAARVTTAGTLLDTSGNAIQLASQGNESFPAVAALGTNFLVAWADDRNFSSDIYAARVFGDGSVPDFDGFPVCTLPNNQINPAVAANADTWLIVWQNQGQNNSGNDLYSARVSANGSVQDFLSVPLVGTGDRTSPRLAYGGAGKFLLVSQAFRGTNSLRVAASLTTADPALSTPTVQFKSASYSVLEKTKVAKVTVTVTGKYSGVVTVDFSTADGTAVAGSDYMPVANRLVFSGKKTSTIVAIPIFDDQVAEPGETVTLTLQNPTGGVLLGAKHTAVLTILP